MEMTENHYSFSERGKKKGVCQVCACVPSFVDGNESVERFLFQDEPRTFLTSDGANGVISEHVWRHADLSAKLQVVVVVPSVMSGFDTTLQRLFRCQHHWTGLCVCVWSTHTQRLDGKVVVSQTKGYKVCSCGCWHHDSGLCLFPSMPLILAAAPSGQPSMP